MTEVINMACIQKEYSNTLSSNANVNLVMSNNAQNKERDLVLVGNRAEKTHSGDKDNSRDVHSGSNELVDYNETEIVLKTRVSHACEESKVLSCSETQTNKCKQERITDIKNLICPYCQKKFEDEISFNKHKEIHVGEWPFTCHVCHKGFLLHHLLESHTSYHKTEIFPCVSCDKKCVSRYKLKLHMRMHINQFICRVCKESFPTKESLKIHKSSHKRISVKKQIYICKICSAKFPVHIELKIHMRMHSTEWPFCCDVCKKLYRRKGSFLTHVSKCLGMSPYSCDICDKSFTRQRQFVQHVQESHNGIRPFKCSVCSKRFNSKSNLEIHSQVHSARLPTIIYKCSLCQQMFNSPRKLRGHKIREHSLYRPFKCNTCKKHFLFKSQLNNHSKEHRIKEL